MEEESLPALTAPQLPSAPQASVQKVGQEQIHELLMSDRLSWQAIIYDLINTEQLDPWDIDIALLAQCFLERVRALEEANFFISSKVLLAAALLLRMKSELLLERELRALDEVLFGKKEERRTIQERLQLDDEVPELMLRTPLPRFKKVTLPELMKALSHAITTENRRIRKVVIAKQQEYEAVASLPKQRINVQERIREVYARLREIFKEREHKLPFSEFAGHTVEERIATFIPLLHLDTQHKIWLEQEGHFAEIWILLKPLYEKQNAHQLEAMAREVEEEMKTLAASLTPEEKARLDELEQKFQEPLADEQRETSSSESTPSRPAA